MGVRLPGEPLLYDRDPWRRRRRRSRSNSPAVRRVSGLVDSGKAYVFAAVRDPRSSSELEARFPWICFLWEADGLARACGAGPQGLWLIADPMQTIMKVGALADRRRSVSPPGRTADARRRLLATRRRPRSSFFLTSWSVSCATL